MATQKAARERHMALQQQQQQQQQLMQVMQSLPPQQRAQMQLLPQQQQVHSPPAEAWGRSLRRRATVQRDKNRPPSSTPLKNPTYLPGSEAGGVQLLPQTSYAAKGPDLPLLACQPPVMHSSFCSSCVVALAELDERVQIQYLERMRLQQMHQHQVQLEQQQRLQQQQQQQLQQQVLAQLTQEQIQIMREMPRVRPQYPAPLHPSPLSCAGANA